MYTPESFAETRCEVLVAAMQDIQFACLVTCGSERLAATHLPVVTETHDGQITLEGHFARANPHWKLGNQEMPSLVIFQGPQAYVHPGWYPSKQANGKAVPTWNYIAVHAHGIMQTFMEPDALRKHLDKLTHRNETQREKPWSTNDTPEKYMDAMMRGIVGFRMNVSHLEGNWKLSQNKSDDDFEGVLNGFHTDEQPDAPAIVQAMLQSKTATEQ